MNPTNIRSVIILSLALYSSIDAQYWTTDTSANWYARAYNYIFNTTIDEATIPNLLQDRDCLVFNNTTICPDNHCIDLNGKIAHISDISTLITSGSTLQAFNTIVKKAAISLPYNIQLRKSTTPDIQFPLAIGQSIILDMHFFKNMPDAVKLFVLYHELQHHLYADVLENHITKIMHLAEKQGKTEQLPLVQNSLMQHIRRYVEFRSDTKAVESFDCPYCLEEVCRFIEKIYGIVPYGTYEKNGYLHPWQIQPRIDLLISEKKCCQHHHDTDNKININQLDESTLLDRLQILNY